MRYAIIQGGVVANIIDLDSGNAADFVSAVATDDAPVQIGDQYADGKFARGSAALLQEANDIIAQTDAELVALEYKYALLTLGLG